MNNSQNYQQPQQQYQSEQNAQRQQPQNKKSKVGIILLIVFLCLLPVIILVAIMLISLGVLLFNRPFNIASNAVYQINDTEVSTFNARIENFLGNDKDRNTVISLVQSIKVDNMYETNQVNITVKFKDGSEYTLEDVDTNMFGVYTMYDVFANKDKMGYYNEIIIVEK